MTGGLSSSYSGVNIFTGALGSGNPSAAAQAAIPSGAGGFACDESTTAGVPASNVDYLRCDATTHQILFSFNNGAEAALAPIANPTFTGSATAPIFNATTPGTGYRLNGTAALYFPNADTSSIAVGNDALAGQTNASGSNSALGKNACGTGVESGGNNTCLGNSAGAADAAGNGNVFVGASAGSNIASGNDDVYVGYAITASGSGASDEIVIGYNNTGLGNDTVLLGSPNTKYSSLKGTIKAQNNTQLLTANSAGITATTPGTTEWTWGALFKSTNYSLHCSILYSQALAAAGVGFAIQSATTAATRIDAWGSVFTTNTGTSAQGAVQNLTSTTATSIVSATPGVAGTIYQASLDGTIQVGATAGTLNILVYTGNASDAITIYAGSYCAVLP